MKTSFNLFTILVTLLCIDGLNGDDAQCEVCSDSNDPTCLKVEFKKCPNEEPYCIDAYFKPSSDFKTGKLIKQCGLFCPAIEGTQADICKFCLGDKCNRKKNIDYYVKELAKKKA